MELVFYLDPFRRASAHSVSVVIPYFPNPRQDRMGRGREAISARVVANLLDAEIVNRIHQGISITGNPGKISNF